MHHAELQLGEPHAHPVEMDRVLHLTGDRRPGEPGVHAQRQIELAALGVERVVDRVARRVHAVAPERRADHGVRDLVVGDEALERAQGRHRAQEVVTTDADAEAVGPRVDERQDAIQRPTEVGHEHGPLHAHAVHLVEQLGQLAAREHRLAGLEVVVLDADHPLGLLHVAHVGVHEQVVGPCDDPHRCLLLLRFQAGAGSALARRRARAPATSRNASPLFGSGSLGSPSARSPMTLRWIWSVPP